MVWGKGHVKEKIRTRGSVRGMEKVRMRERVQVKETDRVGKGSELEIGSS